MDIFLMCTISAMGSFVPIVSSNACRVATQNSSAVQTNNVVMANVNGIVNEFANKFSAAYNAKKPKELASLLGNKSQYWILNRLKKTGGKIEIKVKKVNGCQNKIIAATLSVSHSEMGTIVWDVQLQDVNGAYRLVNTEIPDVQKKNELLKDAHAKAMSLISEIDSSNIVGVKSMFKEQKVEGWVLRAIECRSRVSLVSVRMNKTTVSANFVVLTDKVPVNENLFYSVDGFYVDGEE